MDTVPSIMQMVRNTAEMRCAMLRFIDLFVGIVRNTITKKKNQGLIAKHLLENLTKKKQWHCMDTVASTKIVRMFFSIYSWNAMCSFCRPAHFINKRSNTKLQKGRIGSKDAVWRSCLDRILFRPRHVCLGRLDSTFSWQFLFQLQLLHACNTKSAQNQENKLTNQRNCVGCLG